MTTVLASVYLFRHGRVRPDEHDALSLEGVAFRDALPTFLERQGIALEGAFFDASVTRCRATVERLECPKRGFGTQSELRTINAVLSSIRHGRFALCCRGDSIESGQLYHVHGFTLHTPFRMNDYGDAARKALHGSYHRIYCLELVGQHWQQQWVQAVD
jgi:hypothetical protein